MQDQKFKPDEVVVIVDGYKIIPFIEIDDYLANKAEKKKNKLIRMFNRITLLHDILEIPNEDKLPISYFSNGVGFQAGYGFVKKSLIERCDHNQASEHENNLVRTLRAYLKKLEYTKELSGK